MWSLLLTAALAADCPEPTSLAAFQDAVTAGETAFAELDLVGLHAARDAALEQLSCMDERVKPTDAAAFHRLMGMVAFTARQKSWVLQEFSAARRLDPGYGFPTTVAQPGHPLVALYEDAIDTDDGPLEPISPPELGFVVVDGVRGAPRPTEISSIVQVFEPPDSLAQSLYLLPGEPTPHWGAPPVDWTRRRHRWLFLGTGVATGLSSLLYATTLQQRGAYFDVTAEKTEAQLAATRVRVNAMNVTALGAGMVGMGLCTALVWTW